MGKRIVIVLLLAGILGGMLALPAGAVDLQLAAPSAVLMDLATGTVLYETNSHERLAPASVTKVMTLLLIMEAVDSGKISWQDTVTASEAAAAKGGSQVYLKVGETMSVEEMVKSITVSSANDCACAMAEFLAGSEAGFVEKMNARAKELGMEDTHFVNCTGLDDEPSAAEHLTSAYDIALMSRELLLHHPDIKKFTTIWMDTVRNGAFGLANTNKLVRFYEGTTGLKTGYTSSAGHCLSASAQPGWAGAGGGGSPLRQLAGPVPICQGAAGLRLCQLCPGAGAGGRAPLPGSGSFGRGRDGAARAVWRGAAAH